MANHLRDIVGRRFGKLVVESHAGTEREANWRARCDCGNERVVRGTKLRSGLVVDCGCGWQTRASAGHDKTRKHGMEGTRTYRIWRGMKARTTNPSNKDWDHYGGRGIKITERWLSFSGFLSDMGECPGETLTIERVDVDGNYCPENCVWATMTQQQRNRRNNKLVAYRGRTMPLSQACEEGGALVGWHKARNRIFKHNWPIERAVETP